GRAGGGGGARRGRRSRGRRRRARGRRSSPARTYPRCVRLLVAAAVVVVGSVVVAVVLTGRGGHHARMAAAERSCPLAIQFGDAQYFGTTVKQTLRLGRRLGWAIVNPCPDAILSPPAPVPPGDGVVVAIAGVRPSVALGAADSPHTA